MPIAQSMLPEFDHEMANTRKVLERIPDDKFGFKPHPRSMGLGDIGAHVAMMVGWAIDTLTAPNFDIAPGGKMVEFPRLSSRADILRTFDEHLPKARAALAASSDEAMMQPWSLLQNGKPMFTMPRVATMRTMILNHIIHHRAQLTVYLRLNDVPVPAIYGPSADEK